MDRGVGDSVEWYRGKALENWRTSAMLITSKPISKKTQYICFLALKKQTPTSWFAPSRMARRNVQTSSRRVLGTQKKTSTRDVAWSKRQCCVTSVVVG